ncbi:MAG: dCTP deaminase [Candidatus Bathyarchaeia archaeon]|jgi:dCTP deaminase
MILSALDLKKAIGQGSLTINPLSVDTIRENGVDLRFSGEIVRLCSTDKLLDIQSPDNEGLYVKEKAANYFVLGKYEKMLVATQEKVKLSKDLMAFCQLRSTFARAGVSIPPTVVDAGFEGNLTIQVSGGPFPVKIPVGTRFLHLVFAELKTPLVVGYEGKYKHDNGVATPKKDR